MQHRLFAFLVLLLSYPIAHAQIDAEQIVFDQEIYNFGTVPFGNQPIHATFIFTNTSDYDFVIKKVEASCGCTVPSWPDKPIKPGMKGVISAQFDPTNLAGEVDKDIELFANFNRIMSKRLRIRGTIQEPIRNDPNSFVPGQFGYLRLSGQVLGFGEVKSSETITKKAWVVNDYNLPLTIQGVEKAPNWINIEFDKLKLNAGDTSHVTITIHADSIHDLGVINERVLIATTDRFYRTKSLMIALEVMHDFGDMKRKDWKNKPTFTIDSRTIDMGDVQEGAKVSKVITIKNTGKTPLKILKTKADCSCTVLTNIDQEIPPGGALNATITLDSIFMHDLASKTVILYTNDPSNPKIQLTVMARVREN